MDFLKPKPDSYLIHFFKYIPFVKQKHIEDILLNNRLYFSFANEFKDNDAYDCRAFNFVIKTKEDREQLIKDDIKERYPGISRQKKRDMLRANMKEFSKPDHPYYTERMESMNRIFKEGAVRARIGILCLTDSPKRIEMWNAYIPDNKGVCIRLNGPAIVRHLFSTDISANHINPHLNWLKNVEYIDEPLEIPWAEERKTDPLNTEITRLYSKLNDFSFEQEWRFTIYECINQSIEFPEVIIEEVFYAPDTTDDQKKLLNRWNEGRTKPYVISPANIP